MGFSVSASTSESARTALSLVQIIHLFHSRRADAFKNQLSNSVARLDMEVLGTMVEEHHTNTATIVAIDHTGSNVDVMFYGESRTRSHAAIVIGRNGDGKVRLHHSHAAATRNESRMRSR